MKTYYVLFEKGNGFLVGVYSSKKRVVINKDLNNAFKYSKASEAKKDLEAISKLTKRKLEIVKVSFEIIAA